MEEANDEIPFLGLAALVLSLSLSPLLRQSQPTHRQRPAD